MNEPVNPDQDDERYSHRTFIGRSSAFTEFHGGRSRRAPQSPPCRCGRVRCCLHRRGVPHIAVRARRLGMFHGRLVLPVFLVVRGLQMVVRRRLILRGRLKVRVVLAAMVGGRVLRSFAHVLLLAGVRASVEQAAHTCAGAITVPQVREMGGERVWCPQGVASVRYGRRFATAVMSLASRSTSRKSNNSAGVWL